MQPTVLVLGAYGLIGAEIVRALRADGCEVIGLVRSRALAARLLTGIPCRIADIARLVSPEDWRPFLAGVDVVVNASGALQSGPRDNVAAVQATAIKALVAACEEGGPQRFVQISAPGAEAGAATEFMATKAAGDGALRASTLDWIIFRPGLVIASGAYGGTALIRMLAGFPLATPLVLPDVKIQTVAAGEVASAVCAAVSGRIAAGSTFDLVEDEAHALRDIVIAFRRWMGLSPAPVIVLPRWLGYLVARAADIAGALGWRSPLRTTALKVLEQDVVGDPAPWRAATGQSLASLGETLQRLPATRQERVFARVQLVAPLIVVVLSLFFIVSGMIGAVQARAAAAVIAERTGPAAAMALVLGGSLLDIALGAAILVRRWARAAAMLMIALSAAYLGASLFTAPHLWLDPLGPLVKIFPVMALALCAALMLEER